MTRFEDLSEKAWPGGTAFWEDEFSLEFPGLVTLSVGWLGDSVPETGAIPDEAMEAIEYFSTWALVEDFFLGRHLCQLCREVDSHGEFWIITPSARYVLPQMALHYIRAHQYKPPEPFLRDLLAVWRNGERGDGEFPYGVAAQQRKIGRLTDANRTLRVR